MKEWLEFRWDHYERRYKYTPRLCIVSRGIMTKFLEVAMTNAMRQMDFFRLYYYLNTRQYKTMLPPPFMIAF